VPIVSPIAGKRIKIGVITLLFMVVLSGAHSFISPPLDLSADLSAEAMA
jgi:hypothetical protein